MFVKVSANRIGCLEIGIGGRANAAANHLDKAVPAIIATACEYASNHSLSVKFLINEGEIGPSSVTEGLASNPPPRRDFIAVQSSCKAMESMLSLQVGCLSRVNIEPLVQIPATNVEVAAVSGLIKDIIATLQKLEP